MRGTRSHERAQVLLGRLEAAGAAAEAEQGRARETLSHSMRAVEHKIAGFQASEAARYTVSDQAGQSPLPRPTPPRPNLPLPPSAFIVLPLARALPSSPALHAPAPVPGPPCPPRTSPSARATPPPPDPRPPGPF